MAFDVLKACSWQCPLKLHSLTDRNSFFCFFYSSEENANFEPFAHNLPILFALAHKNNVSKDSSFYKVWKTKCHAWVKGVAWQIRHVSMTDQRKVVQLYAVFPRSLQSQLTLCIARRFLLPWILMSLRTGRTALYPKTIMPSMLLVSSFVWLTSLRSLIKKKSI